MPAPVCLRLGASPQKFSESVFRVHEICETGIVRIRMILFRGRVIPVIILPRPFGSRGVNLTTIKSLALFSVADEAIGAGYLFKFLFRLGISGIEVGMQLFRKFSVSFLNIIR